MPRFLATDHALPAGPPPEVLEQVDVAWGRARDLADSRLNLHFVVDAPFGRVSAELRSADGAVLERLSASEALALSCGDRAAGLALAM